MANKTFKSFTPQGLDTTYKVPATAPEYAATNTYAVGDLAVYQGVLYKCTTAIDTPEAWTVQHWQDTTIGDEVSTLKESFTSTNIEKFEYTDELFDGKYWAIADGTLTSSSNGWARSNQRIDESVVSIEITGGYKLFLLAYQDSTYIGTWFGNGWSKTYNASYISKFIDIAKFRKEYPNYQFYLDVSNISGTKYNFPDITSNIVFNRSTAKNQDMTIKTIYGDIADPKFWEYGYINTSGEKNISIAGQYKRLSTLCYIRPAFPITIKPKSGYSISITTYSLGKTFENQFSVWSTSPYTLSNTEKLYKIGIKENNDAVLAITDIGDYIGSEVNVNTPFNRLLSEVSNVKAVNHRGYNVIAPENTLPAFELSAELGYKYVECDVLFTSDNTPVIMHDDTIDRTCCLASDGSAVTGNIAIDSLTYSDLTSTYDACTSAQWAKWKGTKVPTFAEFMYCCKARNLHPWIELKWTHTFTLSEVQQLISIVKQYGMEENVTFISFSDDALALVATEWDNVELGLNGAVSDALALQTGKNRVFMIYEYDDDYSAAITAGLQVCVYVVNTETVLYNVTNQGFDSVLTNALLPSQINDVVRSKYQSTI